MKLDPRIKETAIIGHCFNFKELKEYIGQKCYFTNDLESFSDLRAAITGVLKAIGPDNENCYLVELKVNGSPADFYYGFCLPAEFVEKKDKKKEYRAYTLDEFKWIFKTGTVISFRTKEGDIYKDLLLGGYVTDGAITKILIGSNYYTLEELFTYYEWTDPLKDSGYQPFGVAE